MTLIREIETNQISKNKTGFIKFEDTSYLIHANEHIIDVYAINSKLQITHNVFSPLFSLKNKILELKCSQTSAFFMIQCENMFELYKMQIPINEYAPQKMAMFEHQPLDFTVDSNGKSDFLYLKVEENQQIVMKIFHLNSKDFKNNEDINSNKFVQKGLDLKLFITNQQLLCYYYSEGAHNIKNLTKDTFGIKHPQEQIQDICSCDNETQYVTKQAIYSIKNGQQTILSKVNCVSKIVNCANQFVYVMINDLSSSFAIMDVQQYRNQQNVLLKVVVKLGFPVIHLFQHGDSIICLGQCGQLQIINIKGKTASNIQFLNKFNTKIHLTQHNHKIISNKCIFTDKLEKQIYITNKEYNMIDIVQKVQSISEGCLPNIFWQATQNQIIFTNYKQETNFCLSINKSHHVSILDLCDKESKQVLISCLGETQIDFVNFDLNSNKITQSYSSQLSGVLDVCLHKQFALLRTKDAVFSCQYVIKEPTKIFDGNAKTMNLIGDVAIIETDLDMILANQYRIIKKLEIVGKFVGVYYKQVVSVSNEFIIFTNLAGDEILKFEIGQDFVEKVAFQENRVYIKRGSIWQVFGINQ